MIPHHRTAFRAVMLLLSIAAESNSEPFKNLNFEQGRIQVPIGGADATEVLIPGWTLTFDGQVHPWMLAGSPALGNPTAWLADSRIPGNFIQGRFSVGLVPGFTSPSEPRHWADYGLSQRGDIPADSQALRFQTKGDGEFDVRIDGVSLVLIDESPTDLWYAADVKLFAGQDVLLEFYTSKGSPETGFGWVHILDTIEFSPNPVIPEPSAIGVLACGVGVLLLFRRK